MPTQHLFDLNLAEVLQHWNLEHALREIISNALDEQLLSGSAEVEIFKDKQEVWHIRDFGRGLRIEHFTLNENVEKLETEQSVIGQFGVGLKDAMATFHRRGVGVTVRSRHGTYTLTESAKHNFREIITLHVAYDDTPIEMEGTEFVLRGLLDKDMEIAQAFFLKFAPERVLDETPYGQIFGGHKNGGRVYIRGVLVNEEPNFLFSYNVTDLTASMKKKLNRERTNVGRAIYTERIKTILRHATHPAVQLRLTEQLRTQARHELPDELKWADIHQLVFNWMHPESSAFRTAKPLFDLNIEGVLEHWEVEHALREIIANALDEQLLTESDEISIIKDEVGDWHIRDFGRGLQIEQFTLNESQEKHETSLQVIGKFGVGLKDALATFHRNNVGVLIRSAHGTYRLRESTKHNFDDIVTLHVEYDETPTGLQGTEFVFRGVTDEQLQTAKQLFLKFSKETVIEQTSYGEILARQGKVGRVYILGVLANEEPNFLFSYNITSLTKVMKRNLNRERTNVGRATYSDRVRAILRLAESDIVNQTLIEQVRQRAKGNQGDEMAWLEISQKALNLMHEASEVVYFTQEEIQTQPHVLDNAKADGYEVQIITGQQKSKLQEQMVNGGPTIRIVENYIQEYNDSFQFDFIKPEMLTEAERSVYAKTEELLALVGLTGSNAPPVRISEIMRATNDHFDGLWSNKLKVIIIRRHVLSSLHNYAATLLHEAAHASSGAVDTTRAFEDQLTEYLGKVALLALAQKGSDSPADESDGILATLWNLFKG